MQVRDIVRAYLRTSIGRKLLYAFLLGVAVGGAMWAYGTVTGNMVAESIAPYLTPFGSILVNMLKMVVVPVVFFSLISGASSLPVSKLGRIGGKTIGWYMLTSVIAAILGLVLALLIRPGAGAMLEWQKLIDAFGAQATELAGTATSGGSMVSVIIGMFANPFEALSTMNFLAIIVFAILFGVAMSVLEDREELKETIGQIKKISDGIVNVMFKIIDWVLQYAPLGVFALTAVNFGLYGPSIAGPYISIVGGVVVGIFIMIFCIYSTLNFLFTKTSPVKFFSEIRDAMVTSFTTRSSAATLPVSMNVARNNLRIREELVSFSLPLGATINMDGVCIHLPFFAVLASEIFGLELGAPQIALMVFTTVLASIGAGGVPGGSLMLLFVILGPLGLTADQIGIIVALALAINPITDMFETMNNVTGDLVCTNIVAHTEGMVES
jgi:Na+/H+-dicarboxylate symporter